MRFSKKMKLQTHHEFDAAERLVTHSPIPTRLLEFHEEDVQDILALRRVPGVVADLVHDGAAGPPLIVVACVHNLCLRRTQVQHGIAPVRRRVRDKRRVRKGWIQRAVERDTEVSHTHRGSPCMPLDARSSRVHTEACGCAIGQECSVRAPLYPPPEPFTWSSRCVHTRVRVRILDVQFIECLPKDTHGGCFACGTAFLLAPRSSPSLAPDLVPVLSPRAPLSPHFFFFFFFFFFRYYFSSCCC